MEEDDSEAFNAAAGDTAEQAKTKRSAPRKRMRKLFKEIRDQMEFYFSDSNLRRDRYLRKQVEQDADGFVPLEVFQNFNKMKSICIDLPVIAKAITKCSQLLEVSGDGARVRRRTPLRDESAEEVDSRTVYVESLPQDVDHDWVKSVFSDYGKITYVSLPRWKSTKQPKGFAFVEFETAQEADMCCKSLGSEDFGQAHCFPKGSKDFVRLQRRATRKCIQVEPVSSRSLADAADGDASLAAAANEVRKSDVNAGDEQSSGEAKPTMSKRAMSEDEQEEEEDGEEDEQQRTLAGNEMRKKKSKMDASTDDQHVTNDERKPRAGKRKVSQDEKEEEEASAEDAECSPRKKKKSKRSKAKHQSTRGSAGDASPQPQEADQMSAAADARADSTANAQGERCTSGDDAEDQEQEMHDSNRSADEAAGDEATEGKKSRRVRKKKSKAAKSDQKINRMEVDTLKLKVIPKARWLALRAEYLSVQKVNMAALKKALQRETGPAKGKRRQQDAAASVAGEASNRENERNDRGAARLPDVEFVPDVIVSVKCGNGTLSRQRVKACLTPEVEVAYLDIADGALEGFVRCKTAASASELCRAQCADDLTFVAVTGEQERDYWEKLKADREKKRAAGQQKSTKKKRRGAQKLAAKAERITASAMDAPGQFGASHGGGGLGTKHIRFEG